CMISGWSSIPKYGDSVFGKPARKFKPRKVRVYNRYGQLRPIRGLAQPREYVKKPVHVRESVIGIVRNRKILLGIFLLAGILSGISIANGPLFHSYLPGQPVDNDPILPIWWDNLVGNAHATPVGVAGPYTVNTDDGGTSVNSPQDSLPQNPVWYAQGRWWVFYPGSPLVGTAQLNYTTATSLSGPWTEYGTGKYTNPVFSESTELAYAHNSTHVFILATPRSTTGYFMQAALNADGSITIVGGLSAGW